jgi:sugar lactone lactonase YvrE
MDLSGNVYVADTCNNTVRKVTPTGTVTTIAGDPERRGYGDGTGQEALFSGPAAVALDREGNVYVTDSYNTAVRKIDVTGRVTTVAGSPSHVGNVDGFGNAARFTGPEGVAVDSTGTVYVADTYNHTIRKITSAGTVTTWVGVAGQSGSTDGRENAARFDEPAGLAIDTVGNVYVADRANRIVRKITLAAARGLIAGVSISRLIRAPLGSRRKHRVWGGFRSSVRQMGQESRRSHTGPIRRPYLHVFGFWRYVEHDWLAK